MNLVNSLRLSIRQRSPFLWKRIEYWVSRIWGTRLQKAKSLHFVTINGQQFKRLILCDAYASSEIARNLEVFRESNIFPDIVIRYERELWVEFIEGHPIKKIDICVAEKMASFYSCLYAEGPRLVDTDTTLFPGCLKRDLRFLNQIGILPENVWEELKHSADVLKPKRCWIGYDYTDPVKKNFVLNPRNQSLCAVDVEGLVREHLIGMGASKALVRWMNPFKEEFLRFLALRNVPDIQSYYGFIELCFLAQWMKRAVFERDWKAINLGYFQRYRGL